MLIDISNKPTKVKPSDSESYELLIKAKKDLGSSRFNKVCRTIDKELDRIVSDGLAKNKLVFTKAGFIVGHSSFAPHKDVQHIWDSAEQAFPSRLSLNRIDELAAETQLKFVGGLVRWRISLRDETWLVYRQPSGSYNRHTGKEIKISEYWINDSFTLPKPHSVSDLKRKFSESRAF